MKLKQGFPLYYIIRGFPCFENFINEVGRLHGEREKAFAASAYTVPPFSRRIIISIVLLKYFSNSCTAVLWRLIQVLQLRSTQLFNSVSNLWKESHGSTRMIMSDANARQSKEKEEARQKGKEEEFTSSHSLVNYVMKLSTYAFITQFLLCLSILPCNAHAKRKGQKTDFKEATVCVYSKLLESLMDSKPYL